jgi:hypothetical protein
MRRAFLPLILLGLAACSGGFGTMDRVMASWEGAPLDAVIAQWGYPHQEQTIAGHKLYRWFYTKTFAMPATTTGSVTAIGNTAFVNTTTMGGGIVRGDCVRTLEVNERNIVTKWEWSGNNCPFADILEYSNWQRRP